MIIYSGFTFDHFKLNFKSLVLPIEKLVDLLEVSLLIIWCRRQIDRLGIIHFDSEDTFSLRIRCDRECVLTTILIFLVWFKFDTYSNNNPT